MDSHNREGADERFAIPVAPLLSTTRASLPPDRLYSSQLPTEPIDRGLLSSTIQTGNQHSFGGSVTNITQYQGIHPYSLPGPLSGNNSLSSGVSVESAVGLGRHSTVLPLPSGSNSTSNQNNSFPSPGQVVSHTSEDTMAGLITRLYQSVSPTDQADKNERRAEQNRQAQRAFRRRRAQYIRELEEKARTLVAIEPEIGRMREDNIDLKFAFDSLNEEIRRLKEIESLETGQKQEGEALKPIDSLAEISDEEGFQPLPKIEPVNPSDLNLADDEHYDY